jgi:hypothetical protein
MSAIDVMRSLAESRENDHIIVGQCITYGQVRAMVLERDQLRELLGNLLARIHGDGGHYQAEHGTEQAAKDAEAKIIRWAASHDVLVKYSRTDGRREWASVGAWLYPGDAIVIVTGDGK